MKYFYDGRERLVGRRAGYASVPSTGVEPLETDWKVEDRTDLIASDGIPSETTFFWDPISDNLIAVFKAGANNGAPGGGAVDTNGGLVRQIIHGSLQYDDPIEVAVADPSIVTLRDAVIPSVARKVGGGAAREASISTIGHLHPVYDEAAAGSLQAVFNVNGEVVSRNFAEGAYGEDEYSLGGAAVDRVAIKATKDEQGNVSSVEVTLRTTESLKSSTLAAGLRLAAVTKDGEVVRSSSAVPSLFDNNDATAVWKLTAPEWNALVDPATVTVGAKTLTPAALSIAATTELRAEAWGDVPVLAAPDWATQSKPLFTSAALPVEVRESLANLSTWLSSIPSKSDRTEALYEVDDLAALGTERTFGGSSRESSGDPAQLLLGAAFHAQPFVEPLTGKNYVRARWYDPATGTWLTADPLGYRDSSNTYAFCAGDPINCSDPTGEVGDQRWSLTPQQRAEVSSNHAHANPAAKKQVEEAARGALVHVGDRANAAARGALDPTGLIRKERICVGGAVRVGKAAASGGVKAGALAAWAEYKMALATIPAAAKSLPGVRSGLSLYRAYSAQGAYAKGYAYTEAAGDIAEDLLLFAGLLRVRGVTATSIEAATDDPIISESAVPDGAPSAPGDLPAIECYPVGSFSICDWRGYPATVPRPEGPFVLLQDAEYQTARRAANAANNAIRRSRGLVGQSLDVHEIHPVKFGGDPVDELNKAFVDRTLHQKILTPWWNELMRSLERSTNETDN